MKDMIMSNYIQCSKHLVHKSFRIGSAGFGLLFALAANHAGATTLYFDPNGASPVTAGTYTWDTTSLEWATSSALSGSLVAWNSADAACFVAGSFTGNITVDVNSAINVAGLFDGNLTPPGCNLTLGGTGSLNFPSGAQALGAGGSDANTVTLNIPITGTGAQPESEMSTAGCQLNLYAANTFTGGFILGANSSGISASQPNNDGVNINNSQSFGIGGLISSTSSTATRQVNTPLAAQNGPITLAQGLTLWNGILLFQGVQSAPVTISGNVALSAAGNTSTLQVQSTADSGAGTAVLTLSGAISGAGNLAKTGAGDLVLSGANSYTGSTKVTAGVLELLTANAIATSSSLVLNGGTVSLGGFNQAMGSSTLGLTASSAIDFTLGGSMSLANSSALTWTGTLDLLSYNSSTDPLYVGTDATGLTSAQLADIEFDGSGVASITSAGLITEVPEPATILLGLVGGLSMMWKARRRIA
jgi:autotransporter-associated beta strand protein